MSSSSSASSSADSEEFFDAEDRTPKSRGGSLRRGRPPIITISSASNRESSNDISESSLPPIIAGGRDPTETQVKGQGKPRGKEALPDEIAKELAALSFGADVRRTRIDKLEQKKKGDQGSAVDLPTEAGTQGSIDDEDAKQSHQDSAESSVEGIYIQGSRPSHPFKVIEPDMDRRSVGSDTTRSMHSRSTGRVSEISGIAPLPFSEGAVGFDLPLTLENYSGQQMFNVSTSRSKTSIPDVVSSSQNELVGAASGATSQSTIMAPPKRPPRRKRTFDSDSAAELLPCGVAPLNPDPKQRSSTRQDPTSNSYNTALFSLDVLSKFGKTSAARLASGKPEINKCDYPYALGNNPKEPCLTEASSHGGVGDMRPTHVTSTTRLHEVSDPLPSPASAVASLTRDLESTLQTLDLQAAMRGQYVVKPQDDIKTRGESTIQESPVGIQLVSLSQEANISGYEPQVSTNEREGKSRPDNLRNRSIKSLGGSGSRISQAQGGHSLGSSTNTSNTNTSSDKSGSGGKRSIHSGSSMDSAGGVTKQLNMVLRTKSDSGKVLSDEEILKQIKVKNLDTGEEMDLVKAEDQLPQSINPLSLHIMRLTSEYVSGDLNRSRLADSDTESRVSSVSGYELGGKGRSGAVKRFFDTAKKKSSVAAKMVAEAAKKKPPKESVVVKEKDVEKIGRLATEIKSSEGVPAPSRDGKGLIFKRIQAHKSGPFDFQGIQFAQEMSSPHLGPIWCMRFSHCGQLLATAGKDMILHIWVLKSAYHYFKDKRNRYTSDYAKTSPTNSYENVISDQMASDDKSYQVFMDTPFASYQGHTSDLLDVSWSKNYFILTSSMDKTVRLWHISRKECLCCFQHIDFVTAISFHPRNDQFFLSGSLDGKLRLWNIPEKKVALWNEVDGASNLITAANFIQNGKFAVVGTYDGRCIFYSTDQLKYYTMIHVRSARGKNSQGRKVTGIEPMPGEDKILITSNDSRIRLYDLRDLSLSCKFKGYSNNSSQIRASFSHDGKYITAGSENQCVYLWRTNLESNNLTVRKDRNSYYEAIKAHNASVTCSVFAPCPDLILDQLTNQGQPSLSNQESFSFSSPPSSPPTTGGTVQSPMERGRATSSASGSKKKKNEADQQSGYVVISGDYDGGMNVFVNVLQPKHCSLPSSSLLSK